MLNFRNLFGAHRVLEAQVEDTVRKADKPSLRVIYRDLGLVSLTLNTTLTTVPTVPLQPCSAHQKSTSSWATVRRIRKWIAKFRPVDIRCDLLLLQRGQHHLCFRACRATVVN
jgi:hypothetical protein